MEQASRPPARLDGRPEIHFACHGEVHRDSVAAAQQFQVTQRSGDRSLRLLPLVARKRAPQRAQPATQGADFRSWLRHASRRVARVIGMALPACAVTDHCSRHGAIGGEDHGTSGFPLEVDLHNGAGRPTPLGVMTYGREVTRTVSNTAGSAKSSSSGTLPLLTVPIAGRARARPRLARATSGCARRRRRRACCRGGAA